MRDWINDGVMTRFFLLVSLELERELVLGELSSPRMVALSMSQQKLTARTFWMAAR